MEGGRLGGKLRRSLPARARSAQASNLAARALPGRPARAGTGQSGLGWAVSCPTGATQLTDEDGSLTTVRRTSLRLTQAGVAYPCRPRRQLTLARASAAVRLPRTRKLVTDVALFAVSQALFYVAFKVCSGAVTRAGRAVHGPRRKMGLTLAARMGICRRL